MNLDTLDFDQLHLLGERRYALGRIQLLIQG